VDVGFPTGLSAAADRVEGGPGDHRRVVGAELDWRKANRQSVLSERRRGFGLDPAPEGRVGGDTAGQEQRFRLELAGGADGLDREDFDDRLLKGGGEIGDGQVVRVDRGAVFGERAGRAYSPSQARGSSNRVGSPAWAVRWMAGPPG
jgi:hypothetical protein